LSAETEQWALRLEGRAKYLANQAWAILFFVLFLAVLAVAVFFFAASITKSDLSASDIDSKLNTSTNAVAKLTKDQIAALQDIETRLVKLPARLKMLVIV
jgi:hypothetical protein